MQISPPLLSPATFSCPYEATSGSINFSSMPPKTSEPPLLLPFLETPSKKYHHDASSILFRDDPTRMRLHDKLNEKLDLRCVYLRCT